MEALKIQATDETPSTDLDAEKHVFEFSGKSLPKMWQYFTGPCWLDWIDGTDASIKNHLYHQKKNERSIKK